MVWNRVSHPNQKYPRVIKVWTNIHTFAPNHSFGLRTTYPSTSSSVPTPMSCSAHARPCSGRFGLPLGFIKNTWLANNTGLHTLKATERLPFVRSAGQSNWYKRTVGSGSITLCTVPVFPRREEIVSIVFLQVILLNLKVKFMLQFGVENSFYQPLSQKLWSMFESNEKMTSSHKNAAIC